MNRATSADMRRIEEMAVERGATYESLMNRAGEACSAWLLSHPDMLGVPLPHQPYTPNLPQR